MFCPNCGTKNDEEALFCGNCGTRLLIDVPQETPVQPEVTPVQESAPAQPEVTPVQESAPAQPEVTPVQESVPVQPEVTPVQESAPAQPEVTPVQESVPVQPQQAFGQQPVQQAQFAGQISGQVPGQQPVNKKPARFPKSIIAIVAAGVAVIAAIIIFVCVGKNVTDYKKTAKQYVKAVAECEWNDAYSLLNLPDGEFLTKDAFINVHADATGEKVEKMAADDIVSTYSKTPGNKAVKVGYITDSGMQYDDVYLTVANKHYMLFFKKYKVSAENLVVKDITVKVPKGLTLYINDTIVGDGYKSDASKNGSSSSDEYVIPYLFYGKNDIKVTGDFIEDYTTQLYAAYDEDTFTVGTYNVKYVDSKLEELETQAKTDVDAIVGAVQAKKDYSAISDRICNEEKKNLESTYKSIYDSYNDSYKTVSDLKITKFTTSITDTSFRVDSDDGCPMVKVSIKIGYTYKIQYSGSDKANDKNNTNNSAYIYYKYEDGNWKIDSMYLGLGFY